MDVTWVRILRDIAGRISYGRNTASTADPINSTNKKAPQARGLRGFQGSVLDYIKHITGGNGGIRTLDEALHPILP